MILKIFFIRSKNSLSYNFTSEEAQGRSTLPSFHRMNRTSINYHSNPSKIKTHCHATKGMTLPGGVGHNFRRYSISEVDQLSDTMSHEDLDDRLCDDNCNYGGNDEGINFASGADFNDTCNDTRNDTSNDVCNETNVYEVEDYNNDNDFGGQDTASCEES